MVRFTSNSQNIKMTNQNDLHLIDIPFVADPRGNLAFVQSGVLPFEFKRIYYLFDVPSTAYRGGHSHKEQQAFLIALSGSFTVVLHDGKIKKEIVLNKPNVGLYIPNGIWRELENFSSGAVCLALASDEFVEEDYIRDFDEFLQSKT